MTLSDDDALSDEEFNALVTSISKSKLASIIVSPGSSSQRRLEDALHRACVPLRFFHKSFDNYEVGGKSQVRALDYCRQYADNLIVVLERGICMVLSGGVGTGKTHLAMAVLNRAIQQELSAMYVTVSEMLRHIRSTYSSASTKTEQEVFDDYILVDLLVLDEVGVSIGDEGKRQALIFDVLNGRYSLNKPTIVLSNLLPSEMKEYLGHRVWDRLLEHRAPIVKFNWGSFRRQ